MNQSNLSEIKNNLINRLDELLLFLGVDNLSKDCLMFYGTCPIHDGDNQTALNLYHEQANVPGYWVCNTKKCHEKYNRTIFGFILAILQKKFGKNFTFWKMIDYLDDFVKSKKIENVVVKKVEIKESNIPKKELYKRLKIPSNYFIKRGISKEILQKYEVGDCWTKKTPMYTRAVVPVYDVKGRKIIGVIGRSFFDICVKCNLYHYGNNCPDKKFSKFFSKWRNHGFSKSCSLYNYWFALPFIQKYSTVYIVEGPRDVWKLEQAGIRNSVALYGINLSDRQKILIEMSGAYNIIILLDPDEAGQIALENIKKKLTKYKLEIPNYSKDIKYMNDSEIKELCMIK